MSTCCKEKLEEKLIYQGAEVEINVISPLITEGLLFTAVLYYDARNKENRAVASAISEKTGDTSIINFIFTSKETAKLKPGKCIFEFYITDTKREFGQKKDFATVVPTSV